MDPHLQNLVGAELFLSCGSMLCLLHASHTLTGVSAHREVTGSLTLQGLCSKMSAKM